jgi:hypothetical protein
LRKSSNGTSWFCYNIALLHPKGRHELAHVRAFREMVMKGLRGKEEAK